MSEHKEHNQEFYNSSNTETKEKRDFFANLNSIIVKSGLLAKGAQAASDFISDRVGEMHRNAHRALLIRILLVVGGILITYGAIYLVAQLYEIEQWTTLITGGVLLAVAGLLQFTR